MAYLLSLMESQARKVSYRPGWESSGKPLGMEPYPTPDSTAYLHSLMCPMQLPMRSACYYLLFTDRETEAWRGCMCPVQEWDQNVDKWMGELLAVGSAM